MKAIQFDPNFALKFLGKMVKPRRQREGWLNFPENGFVWESELKNVVINYRAKEVGLGNGKIYLL